MAVALGTLKPPVTQIGALGWLRKNLFSSWFNSVLTLVALWILYGFALALWEFFATANWSVVTTNLRLFMVGRYPFDQAWRVLASLSLLALLVGATWGIWRGIARLLGIGFAAMFAMLLALSFFTFGRTTIGIATLGAMIGNAFLALSIIVPTTIVENLGQYWLALNLALLALGYGLARLPNARRGVLIGWLLSPFIIGYWLYGSGGLRVVATDLWGGLLLTFVLSVAGILLSFPLGVLLALGRQSSYPVIKWFSIAFIEFVRGLPLVTIIFTAQRIFPIVLPENVTAEAAALVIAGFTIFTAAYLAETVRGGLQSIGNGQSEAARAIGLNTFQMLWVIILPQALRNVIPAIVGQFISLFKDTSLVAIVGLLDLTGIATSVISQQEFLGRQSEVLLFISAVYFVCSAFMLYASRRLEKRLGVGER